MSVCGPEAKETYGTHTSLTFLLLFTVYVFEGGTALLLEEGQQLVHMFRPSAEVHRADPKIHLSLQFGCREPELAAFFNTTGNIGMQFPGLCVVMVRAAIADADRR
jgi:hypothetical protein